jgi:hypothetical protein
MFRGARKQRCQDDRIHHRGIRALAVVGRHRMRGVADQERSFEVPSRGPELATLFASSCHPMLEFAGLNPGICRPLLTQISKFANLST